MPRITPIHWRKFEKFLFSVGCEFSRDKGGHRIYAYKNIPRPIVIPRDNALPIFIIRNNLRLLNIDHEKFLSILNSL